MTGKTDPLHFIAAVVSGQNPGEDGLGIEGCSDIDDLWPDLAQLAVSQGMGPLLLKRLQEGAAGSVRQDALALLLTERSEVAVHYMLAMQVQRQVERTFLEANVPHLWLKGIALAQTIYSSPELRPMVDVDMLVPYARREEALALAQSIGFGLDTPLLFDGREGLKHHYYLESSVYRPVRLELHFRLLGAMDRILTVEDQEWFWHYREEVDSTSGGKMTILKPEAHLLYLCAHAMLQHGESDLRLLRLYDLDRLVAIPDFDWDVLIGAAIRMRWTYAVERAFTLTQEYFGTHLPAGVLAELRARRPSTEQAEHVRRRQSRRTTSGAVLNDLAAMGWSDRVRAAGRIVAPPPSYMRWRYKLASNRGLPGAYLRRTAHMASDAVRSMRQRLRHS